MKSLGSIALVLVGACATAGSGDDGPIDARTDAARIDAEGVTDAPDLDAASIDAANVDAASVDAASIDAATAIDAPTPIDAPGCTTTTQQLLVNANLDATPRATGWVETVIDPLYPPITADTGGVAADTAPNRMWLGGLTSGSDSAVQTVTIPAGTTALVLRGKYDVRTSETGGVYDTAAVEMLSSADAVLETAMSLTNQGALTAWTNFTFTFATPHAGQTVKIRFRSTNDLSLETSFFFDSLALDATVCQ